jgi:cytoskeletal protein RodZ
MGTFGLRLRGERERQGLRLVDVAKATKVGAHHLAALEHEDLGNLPEDGVATVYIRTYADHLGLDAGPLIADFVRELEARRPPPTGELEAPEGETVPPPAGEVAEPEGETVPPPAGEVAEPEEETEPPPAGEGAEPEEEIEPQAAVAQDVGKSRRGVPPLAIGGGLIVVLILVVWWWIGGGTAPDAPIARVEPAAGARATQRVEPETPVAKPAATSEAEAVRDEAERPPDPQPGEPPAQLSVPEHGVGTRVVNRRLVGAGDRFAEGTRVWFWTLVQGGSSGDTIRHVWIHEGRETNNIPLTVGGWHWRTHTRKYLAPGSGGRWAVEARDAAGRVLARSEFECFAPPAN